MNSAADAKDLAVPVYASFWRRLVAFAIDAALTTPVIYLSLGLIIFGNLLIFGIEEGGVPPTPSDVAVALGTALLLISLALALVTLAYFALGWRKGRTVGARAAGIQIVGDDGRRLHWLEALVRGGALAIGLGLSLTWPCFWLVATLNSPASLAQKFGPASLPVVALLLDNLWMLFNRRRQTLHDKLIGSIVVRTRTDGEQVS